MDPTPSELDALMARLGSGDRSVFSRVFSLLEPPVRRLCLALTGSEADAADSVQEAMQKIFERASDYDPARPALPWALAIAGWECRTLLRRRQRRREAPEEEMFHLSAADPEEEFLRGRLVSEAVRALGELSPLDQETLVSTFWEESGSGPEAAASGATVRKRRERALTRFRQAFRRLYGVE